jgi:hypothetical protein
MRIGRIAGDRTRVSLIGVVGALIRAVLLRFPGATCPVSRGRRVLAPRARGSARRSRTPGQASMRPYRDEEAHPRHHHRYH